MTHFFLQSQLLQLTGLSQKHKKAFFPSQKVHNGIQGQGKPQIGT